MNPVLAVVSNQTILVVLLVLILVGCFPVLPYNRAWGYAPFGTLISVLVVLLLLHLLGVF